MSKEESLAKAIKLFESNLNRFLKTSYKQPEFKWMAWGKLVYYEKQMLDILQEHFNDTSFSWLTIKFKFNDSKNQLNKIKEKYSSIFNKNKKSVKDLTVEELNTDSNEIATENKEDIILL